MRVSFYLPQLKLKVVAEKTISPLPKDIESLHSSPIPINKDKLKDLSKLCEKKLHSKAIPQIL